MGFEKLVMDSQLLLKRKANPIPMTGLITARSVVITKSFMVITRYSRFGAETRYLHRPPRARRDVEWLEVLDNLDRSKQQSLAPGA